MSCRFYINIKLKRIYEEKFTLKCLNDITEPPHVIFTNLWSRLHIFHLQHQKVTTYSSDESQLANGIIMAIIHLKLKKFSSKLISL